MINRDALIHHRLCLGDRSRKTIKQATALTIRLRQPLLDEPNNDVIGDQATGVHDGLGLLAQRRVRRHRRSEHVTR